MLFIKFSLFVLLALGGAWSAYCGRFTWLINRSGAFSDANNLLADSTKSDDILDNIKAASNLLQRGNVTNTDQGVELILQALIALKPIATQARVKRFECTSDDMDSMRSIKELMERQSRKPYSEPYSNRRLNKLIIGLQGKFGKACLEQFYEQFKEVKQKLDAKRIKVVSQFSGLVCFDRRDKNFSCNMKSIRDVAEGLHKVELDLLGILGFLFQLDWSYVFRDMHRELLGTWILSTHNPKTGKLEITRERLIELYDEIVTKSCDYILHHEEMATIMEKTIQLARSVKLTNDMQPHYFINEGMGYAVAGYAVCKGLKNVDKTKVIDIIGKGSAKVEESRYI